MMRFKAKRCGVQFDPPSIVLIYEESDTNKIRKRIMPIRSFSKYSDHILAAERLKNHFRHKEYLEGVSLKQLEKLHIMLQDHLKGISLKQSISSFHLDHNEDLNKLDNDELARKKGQMDDLFEKNRVHRDDPDFIYDVKVDFTKNTHENCSWDEDSD